ncbi:ribosomal RNA small subunit methyltransferase NEP1-like [Planoprotostelium fungivorum]|uniref:Ribosomal RNA small subunit methyltransferase NEP1-like n=1 Tax=Planoprotostelium fungivorum TaxID=1890364 RepID=A0A2P6NDW1_9EUKA|nr:ribosomal RNA small subunit methyltransferase NEP1-like [Planoprotostelium fungivorum]
MAGGQGSKRRRTEIRNSANIKEETPAAEGPDASASVSIIKLEEKAEQDASSSKVEVKQESGTKVSANEKKLIVLLDGCHLETIKVKDQYQLLNTDDHSHILKKRKEKEGDARPDITHQCLMTLLDSPLNKAGLLQIYIRTVGNILVEVHPEIRIPRTFKRFSGLMVELLHRFSIRSAQGGTKLMKVIKNPVTQYFPANTRKIGLEISQEKLVPLDDYVKANFTETSNPVVFVVGGFSHGDISPGFVEETVSISSYNLSASVTCGKLCSSFETLWGVL